jgi:hypothetical protein
MPEGLDHLSTGLHSNLSFPISPLAQLYRCVNAQSNSVNNTALGIPLLPAFAIPDTARMPVVTSIHAAKRFNVRL